jgi:hypothetical protein
VDLGMNADLLVPLWSMWIAGPFKMDMVDFFGRPPIQVWRTICSLSLFTPLLTITERLFAIPASQAFCGRALWHFRRLLLPSSLNTGPGLTRTGLQAVVSFAKEEGSTIRVTDRLGRVFRWQYESGIMNILPAVLAQRERLRLRSATLSFAQEVSTGKLLASSSAGSIFRK